MKEHDFFHGLDRVAAPPDFERAVLAEISKRKVKRLQWRKTQRWALAGGAAVVLATFVLVGVFLLRKSPDTLTAEFETRSDSLPTDFIPVMETLDYSSEVHNASYEPQTIYILEQVSEASSAEITY